MRGVYHQKGIVREPTGARPEDSNGVAPARRGDARAYISRNELADRHVGFSTSIWGRRCRFSS